MFVHKEMKKLMDKTFKDIISPENLLSAWQEFLRGKRSKLDVQKFQMCLMNNILTLHRELRNGTYRHGPYEAFNISDPKPRNIHKASVRDRLLHHAIYRIIYPFYNKTFIADSFSCRLGKGIHKAINRFRYFAYKASKNNTRTAWILKCDIKKFFTSIDHDILLEILRERISNRNIIWLLNEVISSFHSTKPGKGLPLGNLTSQLLASVYMNEFDQFVKHKFKVRYYVRYADDFVIMSEDKRWLERLIPKISDFLDDKLKLELHESKIFVKTFASGVDFLGWVHFPDHRVLRTATKRRMMNRIQENSEEAIISSYLGLLKHGNTKKIRKEVLKVGCKKFESQGVCGKPWEGSKING